MQNYFLSTWEREKIFQDLQTGLWTARKISTVKSCVCNSIPCLFYTVLHRLFSERFWISCNFFPSSVVKAFFGHQQEGDVKPFLGGCGGAIGVLGLGAAALAGTLLCPAQGHPAAPEAQTRLGRASPVPAFVGITPRWERAAACPLVPWASPAFLWTLPHSEGCCCWTLIVTSVDVCLKNNTRLWRIMNLWENKFLVGKNVLEYQFLEINSSKT